MSKRIFRTLAIILGAIVISIILLLADGPFMVPIRTLDGLASARQLATAGRVAEIRQPVLVVAGGGDAIVPITDSQRLDSELPRSDLVILESCGHVPHEECPESFKEAVGVWLSPLLQRQ